MDEAMYQRLHNRFNGKPDGSASGEAYWQEMQRRQKAARPAPKARTLQAAVAPKTPAAQPVAPARKSPPPSLGGTINAMKARRDLLNSY